MPSDPKEDPMALESTVSELSIAGERVSGPETLEVRSPFDDALVGVVPTVGADAVTAAIDAAAKAMATGLPAHERAMILDRVAASIEARRDEFARLLAQEVAKPIGSAGVEVDRCVQTLRFSAVEARSLAGGVVPMDAHPSGGGRMGWTLRVPTGVIAAITPFNFPLNLAAHKVGPAIAAGCGVVVKPPRTSPLTAVALADAFYEAGLPREWLSVVVGASGEIGDVFVEDPRISMITFTGSSEVGWQLAARAPRKHVALELGNSTPVIICADADLNRAATTLSGSAFGFAGQSCISVQRLIVHESVKDQFTDRLLKETATKKAGDPLEAGVDLGPLIDEAATDRVLSWLGAARDDGAEVLAGGDRNGKLLQPTVVDRTSTQSQVWHDEVFGPVVAMRTFTDVDEAIELANGTDYGLQAGIYTADIGVALRAATNLDFGGVTINETPTFRVDQMPYGGTKESGNTREGPHYTVRAMTEERMVVVGL
jgi:acyl-CoA reductase-like NAD-dependent aldehyde dehydrogenase